MNNASTVEIYLYELNQQVKNYIAELDELATLPTLKNRDYYAAERLLQVLIEACIGISKRWIKRLAKPVPHDAYKSFEILVSHGVLPWDDLIKWRKIIGLRNALVHDYLNVDKLIILNVLQHHYYREMQVFIELATTALSAELGNES
jgi:uncharacterized protein YutE (UPF0331/DUF86 family)